MTAMKTKSFTAIISGLVAIAAATAYSNADTFIVNKTNGLQQRVESTSITFSNEETPVLAGTNIPVTEIADIRRVAAGDFTINVTDVTYHTFTVDIFPKDKRRPFVTTLMQKSKYDACLNRDDVHFYSWDPWRAWAEFEGITVEQWVEQNGVLRTGDYTGVIAESLKPDTGYVLAVYYTDNQGHIDGTVHTAEIHTDAVTMLDTSFDINVEVIGKNINAHIEPSDKNVVYFHGALSMRELETYGNGDLHKAVENYLETWRAFIGKSPEDFIPLITDKGDIDDFVDNLEAQSDFTYVACALDKGMNICSRIDTVNFHTGGILPSDNEITTTFPFVATTRALIDIKTTNQDPYIAKFMTGEEVAGRTPEAIIDSLEQASSPGDLFVMNRRNGNAQIYKDGLKPGKTYYMLVFGYQSESLSMTADAEVTTTPQLLGFTTPETAGPIEDLAFYFMSVVDGNKGASALAVPSEDGMPFYMGCSTSDNKEEIMAELSAKAEAEEMTLKEYLLDHSNSSMAMIAMYLEQYAQQGYIVVTPGIYHVFAIPLHEDGTPVDKICFCPDSLPIGMEDAPGATKLERGTRADFLKKAATLQR